MKRIIWEYTYKPWNAILHQCVTELYYHGMQYLITPFIFSQKESLREIELHAQAQNAQAVQLVALSALLTTGPVMRPNIQ